MITNVKYYIVLIQGKDQIYSGGAIEDRVFVCALKELDVEKQIFLLNTKEEVV